MEVLWCYGKRLDDNEVVLGNTLLLHFALLLENQ